MEYKENLLRQLNEMQSDQIKICVGTTKSAVFSIVGTVWSILIGEGHIATTNKNSHVGLLIVIVVMACIFLGVDAWRHYSVAKKARELHQTLIRGDEDALRIEFQMNKKSDWSFKIFRYQLMVGGVMAFMLIVYSFIEFGYFVK